MTTQVIKYKGSNLVGTKNERGWQVEIISMKASQPHQTMTFAELEDALDEAGSFIDSVD
jgi:hypothetical protein